MKRLLPEYSIEVPDHYLNESDLLSHTDSRVIIPVNNVRILTRKVLGLLPNLKLVQQAGTGIEHIDISAAKEIGVWVATATGANAQAVAEHTFALILALNTKLCEANSFVKTGLFRNEGWPPRHLQKLLKTEIREKTIGLIGLGSVGLRVARIAKHAFQMNVIAYDPYVDKEKISEEGINPVRLDELVRLSDIISIHCLLTNETKNMINKNVFSLMKKSAYIINTARGGIIDQGDLVDALNHGLIAGAGLDTYTNEPPDPADPLLGLDKVIVTPHIGGNSVESKIRVQDIMVENVKRLDQGLRPLNLVGTT